MSAPTFTRIDLERIFLSAQKGIPRRVWMDRATLHAAVCPTTQELIISIDTYIHGLADKRIDIDVAFPQDWWEAVKERWFPHWALKRWPVKYRRVSCHEQIYKSVCPHLPDEGQGRHLSFISQ